MLKSTRGIGERRRWRWAGGKGWREGAEAVDVQWAGGKVDERRAEAVGRREGRREMRAEAVGGKAGWREGAIAVGRESW